MYINVYYILYQTCMYVYIYIYNYIYMQIFYWLEPLSLQMLAWFLYTWHLLIWASNGEHQRHTMEVVFGRVVSWIVKVLYGSLLCLGSLTKVDGWSHRNPGASHLREVFGRFFLCSFRAQLVCCSHGWAKPTQVIVHSHDVYQVLTIGFCKCQPILGTWCPKGSDEDSWQKRHDCVFESLQPQIWLPPSKVAIKWALLRYINSSNWALETLSFIILVGSKLLPRWMIATRSEANYCDTCLFQCVDSLSHHSQKMTHVGVTKFHHFWVVLREIYGNLPWNHGFSMISLDFHRFSLDFPWFYMLFTW